MGPTTIPGSSPHKESSPTSDNKMTPVPEEDVTRAPTTKHAAAVAQISDKLQTLAICTCLIPPQSLTAHLGELESLLDVLLVETEDAHVLPPPKKIPPNKGLGWVDTKAIMHQPVKSKRLRTHQDPYGGGKASGMSARSDAKKPKRENMGSDTRCVCVFSCLIISNY